MTTDHGRSSSRWTRWAVSAPMSRAQATAAGPAWCQPRRMVAPAVVAPAAIARRSVANAHCSRAVPCCRSSPSAVLTTKAARMIAGASSEASAAISWPPRQVGPSSRHPPGRRPLLPAERERRPATQEREHPGEWRAESWACGHDGAPPGSVDGHKAPSRRPDFPAHPTSLDVYFALYLLPALPNSPARNGVGRGPAYPLTPGLVRLAIMRDSPPTQWRSRQKPLPAATPSRPGASAAMTPSSTRREVHRLRVGGAAADCTAVGPVRVRCSLADPRPRSSWVDTADSGRSTPWSGCADECVNGWLTARR